jgi:hypothetical protein
MLHDQLRRIAPFSMAEAHDGLRGQVEEILDTRAKRAHKVGRARRLDTQDDAVHLP